MGRLFAVTGPAFLEEFGIRTRRPAAVRAQVDSERREKGYDKKGRLKTTTSHKLRVGNQGDEDAHHVHREFVGDDPERLPDVIDGDRPIDHLLAGQWVEFPLLVHGGTDRMFNVRLTWLDDEGSEHSVEQTVSV